MSDNEFGPVDLTGLEPDKLSKRVKINKVAKLKPCPFCGSEAKLCSSMQNTEDWITLARQVWRKMHRNPYIESCADPDGNQAGPKHKPTGFVPAFATETAAEDD